MKEYEYCYRLFTRAKFLHLQARMWETEQAQQAFRRGDSVEGYRWLRNTNRALGYVINPELL